MPIVVGKSVNFYADKIYPRFRTPVLMGKNITSLWHDTSCITFNGLTIVLGIVAHDRVR